MSPQSCRCELREEAWLLAAAEVDKVDKSTPTGIPEEVISAEAEKVPDATANVVPRKQHIDVTEKFDIKIGKAIDDICSDEQYKRKVDDSEDKFCEYFKILGIDTKKPKEEFVKDLLKTLDSKLNPITYGGSDQR